MANYKKMPDIIIRNGTIIDGTGKQGYYADIAVVGDKIDYIGDLRGVCGHASHLLCQWRYPCNVTAMAICG